MKRRGCDCEIGIGGGLSNLPALQADIGKVARGWGADLGANGEIASADAHQLAHIVSLPNHVKFVSAYPTGPFRFGRPFRLIDDEALGTQRGDQFGFRASERKPLCEARRPLFVSDRDFHPFRDWRRLLIRQTAAEQHYQCSGRPVFHPRIMWQRLKVRNGSVRELGIRFETRYGPERVGRSIWGGSERRLSGRR